MKTKRLLSALILSCLLPLVASAYDVKINGIYYKLNQTEKTAKVTYYIFDNNEAAYSGPVDIPSSVTYNGVEYSVTSIGNSAFRNCASLTSVTIPSSVTFIDNGAFSYCTGLTSITIPNSVTKTGNYVFIESGLTSITIPSSLKAIERQTFERCSNLKSVTIPNSVTTIMGGAFDYCTSLTSITIPSSVTTMWGAFGGCSSLTSVVSLIVNPFELDEKTFDCYNTAVLYVPKGTKGKYKATPAWNKFQKIEEFSLKGDVNDDGAIDVADIAAVIDVMAKGTNESVADVNDDKAVDVADIGTIIDIMADKVIAEPVIPYEDVYAACPDDNHPHMIDLGLPSGTKWACCNVGASTPEGYGNYYTFEDAKAYNPPTLDQVNEFLNNTTSEWTVLNGVSGRIFTGRNRGTVFLPAAGYSSGGPDIYSVGTNGYFWSSTLDEEHLGAAKDIVVNSNEAKIAFTGTTYMRLSVRPVR